MDTEQYQAYSDFTLSYITEKVCDTPVSERLTRLAIGTQVNHLPGMRTLMSLIKVKPRSKS